MSWIHVSLCLFLIGGLFGNPVSAQAGIAMVPPEGATRYLLSGTTLSQITHLVEDLTQHHLSNSAPDPVWFPHLKMGTVWLNEAEVDYLSSQDLSAQGIRMEADQPVELVRLGNHRWTPSTDNTQPSATWGLDRVDQRSLPLDRTYHYPTMGDTEGLIFVLDTGIEIGHLDLGGRASWGTNTVDNVNTDGHGHGTHVAGTIMSNTYGVAKKAQVVAVKVLDSSGRGSWAGVVAGMEWVLAHLESYADNDRPWGLISMSLGGGTSSIMDEAVQLLTDYGVPSVVAAGNNQRNACLGSPARAPSAFTIGSTDTVDGRSSFSNYGSCVNLFAPGSSITSTWKGGTYRAISGTSMATPHVTGALALLLSKSVDCQAGDDLRNGKTASQRVELILEALTSTATPDVVRDARTTPNLFLYVAPELETLYCGVEQAPPPSPSASPSSTALPVTPSLTPSRPPVPPPPVSPSSSRPPVPPVSPSSSRPPVPPVSPSMTPSSSRPPMPPPPVSPSASPQPEPCTRFQLEVTPDQHPEEFTWGLFHQESNEMVAEGDLEGADLDLCEGGHYTLSVHDSRGDGLCCGYGEGSYTVFLDEEEIYHSTGDFGFTQGFQFTIHTSTPPPAPSPSPHPQVELRGKFEGHDLSLVLLLDA